MKFHEFHKIRENSGNSSKFLNCYEICDFAFWGSRGGPRGGQKGAPSGPPPDRCISKKVENRYRQPQCTECILRVYNKTGPEGGRVGAPLFRQVAFSDFRDFTFCHDSIRVCEIS